MRGGTFYWPGFRVTVDGKSESMPFRGVAVMSRGKVFLSSVFKNLKRTRDRVARSLSELGFTVIRADNKDISWPGTLSENLRCCLDLVDSCDIYLGIYPQRHGTLAPISQLSFTEAEYVRAVSRRLSCFLYTLDVSDDDKEPGRFSIHEKLRGESPSQHQRQKAFLHYLSDTELISYKPLPVESVEQLCERIELDFSKQRIWGSSVAVKVDGNLNGPLLQLLLQPPGDNGLKIDWSRNLNELVEARRISLGYASAVGLGHLVDGLWRTDSSDERALRELDQYLRSWHYVSAWTEVSGIFGQTGVAKMIYSLALLRGDMNNIIDFAGGVCSGLYSDGRLSEAMEYYRIYMRRGHIPSMRGPLALKTGYFELARKCFEQVLQKEDSLDTVALYRSYRALVLAKTGSFCRAGREVDALVNQSALHSTTRIQVLRHAAEVNILARDRAAALRLVEMAKAVGEENDLYGQLEDARRIERKIEAQVW